MPALADEFWQVGACGGRHTGPCCGCGDGYCCNIDAGYYPKG